MPKIDFWGQKFKNQSPDSESALPRYHCVNFQLKQTTLTFLAQICPKRNLKLQIHKTNVGIRISILFSVKTDNFDFFGPNLLKRKLGFEIQKSNVGIRIGIFEIPCVPILRQNEQL